MGEKKYPVTKTGGLRQRGKNMFIVERFDISIQKTDKQFCFS